MSEKFIHPSAVVDEGSKVGEGTRIWHWCHIMKDVIIGKNCNIGENAFIETGVVLGNNVKVKKRIAYGCHNFATLRKRILLKYGKIRLEREPAKILWSALGSKRRGRKPRTTEDEYYVPFPA